MINLKNKIAIVTGGKGQLGVAITSQLKELGATVYDLDLEDLDISIKSQVEKKYKEIFKTHKKVDILVNNAGVSVFEDSLKRLESDLDYVYGVNLKGTFNSINVFTKYFDKYSPNNNSSITNIASLYGIVSPDFRIYEENDRKNSEIYGATKAGIIQMTKYFSVYLADRKIRVNCISPGGIFNQNNPQNDNFIKKYNERCPMKRMGKDTEIAGGVVYLSSDISSYVNGHNLVIDGGYSAW